MEFEALALCSPVVTEWLESAGVGVHPVDVERNGVSESSLIQEGAGAFLGLRTKWDVLLASYGVVHERVYHRFLVVDDEFIHSPHGDQLADGLRFFDGAPVTVINITREAGGSSDATNFYGILDFEFNPLQQFKADFLDRLRLHFAALEKANDWRRMSAGKAVVYAVVTLCALPGLAQLWSNIAFAIIGPASTWSRWHAISSLAICSAVMVLMFAWIYKKVNADKSTSLWLGLLLVLIFVILLWFGTVSLAWWGFLG